MRMWSAAFRFAATCVALMLIATFRVQAGEPSSPATCRAEKLDTLLEGLQGLDAEARARARHLLPQYGAEAVARLVPLMESMDPVLSRSAYTTLRDIAAQCGAPGHKNERKRIHQEIVKLLAPEIKREQKLRGLALVALTMPPDGDVAPVAGLLGHDNAQVREQARRALDAIGTRSAAASMLAAVPSAPPGLQAELISSLARMYRRSPESRLDDYPGIINLMSDGATTAVQVAAACFTADLAPDNQQAAKALADPAILERSVVDAEFADALLKAAERFAAASKRSEAEAIYSALLRQQSSRGRTVAAVGLSRLKSATAAPALIEALNGAPDREKVVLIASMDGLLDESSARLLGEHYQGLPFSVRPAALRVLARSQLPAAMPYAVREASSPDLTVRLAAYDALAGSGQAEGVELLSSATLAQDAREARAASRDLMALAAKLSETPGKEASGSIAYLRILKSSQDFVTRSRALQGLVAAPSAEGTSAILEAAQDKSLRPAATRALAQAIAALRESGKTVESEAAVDAWLGLSPAIGDVVALLARCREIGAELDSTRLLGTVKGWWVAGPFKAKTVDEDFSKPFIEEASVTGLVCSEHGTTGSRWKRVASSGDVGGVSLLDELGNETNCFGYAYAEVEVPVKQIAKLKLGSDDGCAVWVNGAKVFQNIIDRGCQPDSDTITVKLNAGVNRILLKVANYGAGWGYCARLVDKDGRPLRFTEVADQGGAK